MRIPFWRSRPGAGSEKPVPAEVQSGSLDSKLEAIKARFLARLGDDHAVLARYRGGQLPRAPELISVVHRLAGSAGMVGFMEISEAAGRLDDELADSDRDTHEALHELLTVLEKTIPGKEVSN